MGMKKPTVEYLPLAWDDEAPFEVVRGHTDKATAVSICEEEAGIDPQYVSGIEHTRARFIPERAYPCERDTRFVCPASGRGSFPVTLVRWK